MAIKDEINQLRLKLGSARMVAILLNVTEQTIWNWINGKCEPSVSQGDLIRDVLLKD